MQFDREPDLHRHYNLCGAERLFQSWRVSATEKIFKRWKMNRDALRYPLEIKPTYIYVS